MKVLCQKELNERILIGKVEREGKTKWEMKIFGIGSVMFRKSKFKTINDFESFLVKKYNIKVV